MKKIFNKGEVNISRTFNAPLEKVWQAWTVPAMFEKWWGPRDFTIPHIEIDFKVGGKYFYCMKAPDGKEYWGTGIYKEIIPRKKILVTDSFADEKGQVVSATHYGMEGFPLELEVIIFFKSLDDGQTEINLVHGKFPEGEIMELVRQGWEESFDKLEKSLK